MYIFTNRIISKIAIKVNSKGKFVVPGSGIIIMLRSGYHCFLCHRAIDSGRGPKKAGIVRVKAWERGLFFRQRSVWQVVALLCGLLLAGFGFPRVKAENRSIVNNVIITQKLRVVRLKQRHTMKISKCESYIRHTGGWVEGNKNLSARERTTSLSLLAVVFSIAYLYLSGKDALIRKAQYGRLLGPEIV